MADEAERHRSTYNLPSVTPDDHPNSVHDDHDTNRKSASHSSHASVSTRSWVYTGQQAPPHPTSPPLPEGIATASTSAPNYPASPTDSPVLSLYARSSPDSVYRLPVGGNVDYPIYKTLDRARTPDNHFADGESSRRGRSFMGGFVRGLKKLPKAISKFKEKRQPQPRRETFEPEDMESVGIVGNTLPRYLSNPSINLGRDNAWYPYPFPHQQYVHPTRLPSLDVPDNDGDEEQGFDNGERDDNDDFYVDDRIGSQPSVIIPHPPPSPHSSHAASLSISGGVAALALLHRSGSRASVVSHISVGERGPDSQTVLSATAVEENQSAQRRSDLELTPILAHPTSLRGSIGATLPLEVVGDEDITITNDHNNLLHDGDPQEDTATTASRSLSQSFIAVQNVQAPTTTRPPVPDTTESSRASSISTDPEGPVRPRSSPRVSYASRPPTVYNARPFIGPKPQYHAPPVTDYRRMSHWRTPPEPPRGILAPTPTRQFTMTTIDSASERSEPSFVNINPVRRFFKNIAALPWIAKDRVTVDYRPGGGFSRRNKKTVRVVSHESSPFTMRTELSPPASPVSTARANRVSHTLPQRQDSRPSFLEYDPMPMYAYVPVDPFRSSLAYSLKNFRTPRRGESIDTVQLSHADHDGTVEDAQSTRTGGTRFTRQNFPPSSAYSSAPRQRFRPRRASEKPPRSPSSERPQARGAPARHSQRPTGPHVIYESPRSRSHSPLHRQDSRVHTHVATERKNSKSTFADLEMQDEPPADLTSYILAFMFDTVPRQIYLHLLLRLPYLYFSRVTRIFEEAKMSMPEIKKMALEATSHWKDPAKEMPKVWNFEPKSASTPYENLQRSWASFIDSLMREWKTLNIISVLLLSAILTILQIDSAAQDPLTRYAALVSMICALMSLLYGCVYIIRFGTMRTTYKAAEWAQEAQKSRTAIWWNVWVLLAMPAVWLAWSLVLYIVCIMAFVWRTGTVDDGPGGPMTRRTALIPRIVISVVLLLGVVYFILIASTLRRYGDAMDQAWRSRIIDWMQSARNRISGVPAVNRSIPEFTTVKARSWRARIAGWTNMGRSRRKHPPDNAITDTLPSLLRSRSPPPNAHLPRQSSPPRAPSRNFRSAMASGQGVRGRPTVVYPSQTASTSQNMGTTKVTRDIKLTRVLSLREDDDFVPHEEELKSAHMQKDDWERLSTDTHAVWDVGHPHAIQTVIERWNSTFFHGRGGQIRLCEEFGLTSQNHALIHFSGEGDLPATRERYELIPGGLQRLDILYALPRPGDSTSLPGKISLISTRLKIDRHLLKSLEDLNDPGLHLEMSWESLRIPSPAGNASSS
ncbi:hypothetical protein B0H34DRAFT_679922 [Crassisporium funariophilum]|nr:hypothetical protein B0H34DRAFT_679922 [Crassisporium funariophilum]